MVDPLLKRSALWPFLLAMLVGAWAGCSFYSPTVVDCSVSCGEEGPCPKGTSCRQGFCRLEGAMGDCACKLGDTRPCGGGRGECKRGTEVCTSERVWSGICVNEGMPKAEVCNDKDDDCNGLTDDAVTDAVACTLQLGVCAGSKARCESGASVVCSASDYGARYETSEATCDGVDNDCDGFFDGRQARLLLSSAAPRGEWQLLKLAGTYAVVFERRPAGMPGELVVAHFAENLDLLGSTTVFSPAPSEFHARSVGSSVYVVAGGPDGGVWLNRVDPLDGGVFRFDQVADAGFSSGLRLGVGEEVVATYIADDPAPFRISEVARLVEWDLTGRFRRVRDLTREPFIIAPSVLNSVNVSDKGHFAIYSYDDNGGTTRRSLINLEDGGTWSAEFYGGVNADLFELDGGAVSCSYLYNVSGGTVSGVYYLPDLKSSRPEATVISSSNAQAFNAYGGYLGTNETLYTAQLELLQGAGEQLTISTSVPFNDTFRFRLRTLDAGVGAPQVVESEVGWLLLGWREGTNLFARRVCAP
jgi:hypothetical protein